MSTLRTIKTTRCMRHGHPEITLAFDPDGVLEGDAAWFASVLEDMVASGSRFLPGQSLALGWSIVWFTTLPDGSLGLEEPDMHSMPTVRQPGLTNGLRQLRLHKDTLESVLPAQALAFPSLQQSCLVCTDAAPGLPCFMNRFLPDGADSGWFIGCQEMGHNHNDADNLRRFSLYEAALRICPQVLPYLAFPPDSMIYVERRPSFFLGDRQLEIRRDSFLDLKLGR